MQLEEVKKLAEMARIDIGDEELAEIAHDFDAILAYVGQIKEISELSSPDKTTEHTLVNVMREDEVTNTAGAYTEKITNQMPATENGFLKVKQIL